GIGGEGISYGHGDGTGHRSYGQEVSEVFGVLFHGLFLSSSLFAGREDSFPIVFHAYDGPAFGVGFVESFVEPADAGVAVVGPFTLRVGMVDVKTEARARAG